MLCLTFTRKLLHILMNRCIRDPYVQWCERLSLSANYWQGSLLDYAFVLCFHPNIVNCFPFLGDILLIKLSHCERLISKLYLSFKKAICSSISVRVITLARLTKSKRIKRSLVKTSVNISSDGKSIPFAEEPIVV